MIESGHLDAIGDDPAGLAEAREIDRILAELHALREAVVDAWRDSPVMLLRDERERLRAEIRATCEMLTTLTSA